MLCSTRLTKIAATARTPTNVAATLARTIGSTRRRLDGLAVGSVSAGPGQLGTVAWALAELGSPGPAACAVAGSGLGGGADAFVDLVWA